MQGFNLSDTQVTSSVRVKGNFPTWWGIVGNDSWELACWLVSFYPTLVGGETFSGFIRLLS